MRTCAARSGLREGLADMSATTVIYARVSAEAKAWIDEQHQNTGIPMARLIDLILLDARRRNVNFEIRSPVLLTTVEAGKTGSGDTEGDG